MEVAKEFCQRKLTGWSWSWADLIDSLANSFSKGAEYKDEVVKAIVQRLAEFYIKFGELTSQLWKLFSSIYSRYPDVSSKALYDVLSKHSARFRNISGSLSQAKLALPGVRLTVLLLSKVEASLNHLELLSTFLAAIPSSGSTARLAVVACGTVTRNLLTTVIAVRWLSLLVAAPTFNLPLLVLYDLLLAYLQQHQSSAEFPQSLYVDLLKQLVTCVLGSRVRPEGLVVSRCGHLFKRVSHALFKDILLPAMKKALLRNPDELIETVAFILLNVPIDLSQYCDEMAKIVLPLLSSAVTATSEAAHKCMKALSVQSSDKMAALTLLRQLDGALKSTVKSKL